MKRRGFIRTLFGAAAAIAAAPLMKREAESVPADPRGAVGLVSRFDECMYDVYDWSFKRKIGTISARELERVLDGQPVRRLTAADSDRNRYALMFDQIFSSYRRGRLL